MRYRYEGLSETTRRILSRQGEAGRFEYKRDSESVSTRVLVAAANAAVLERLRSVTVLVGVAEEQNPTTGAVTGSVVGLPDVEAAKQRITGRARSLKPVPPRVDVIEENAGTTAPILRVIIRPTRPPHYDDNGARVTRYGASTRAITDEELLDIYLTREASSFRARFEEIARDIEDSIRDVETQARALSDQLDSIEEATSQLQGNTDETFAFVESLDEGLGRVQASVDEIIQSPATIEEALTRLVHSRNLAMLWIRVGAERGGKPYADVLPTFEELSARQPALLAYRRNLREADAWAPLVELRDDTPVDAWIEAAERIREIQTEGIS
jgi:hypothetical protein